jgi:hypothetical protein
MRKLTVLTAVLAACLFGCSKDNSKKPGSDYYFSFQSGNIQYSTTIDSRVQITISSNPYNSVLSMSSSRNQEQTDSAAAGLINLATWTFGIFNIGSQDTTFIGNYTTDSSTTNVKRLSAESTFRFYTRSDPHKGYFFCTYALPFSLTITEWTAASFSGTFQGKVTQYNSATHVYDTASITNGKFKLPLHH